MAGLEHAILDAQRSRPFLIKGLNIDDREDLMTRVLQAGTGRYLCSDYTAMDCNEQPPLLRLRNDIMASCVRDHGEFRWLLAQQEDRLSGRIRNVGYRTTGLASGDPTTSIGNAIINSFITWYALRGLGLEECPMLFEGDDGIVCLPVGLDEERIKDHFVSTAASFGLGAKVFIHDIDGADFCGRWLWVENGNVRSMADLGRTLPKLPTTCAPYRDDERYRAGDLKRLAVAKAMSYLATDSGTPIVAAWCRAVLATYRVCPKFDRDGIYRWAMAGRERVVSDKARAIVAMRLGVSVRYQCWWESACVRCDYYYPPIPVCVRGKRMYADIVYGTDHCPADLC